MVVYIIEHDHEEASSVPGRSVAAAGFTSSNLRFWISLCHGVISLNCFRDGHLEEATYQKISEQDNDGHLADRRNEDGGLFFDFRSKVLIQYC